MVEARATFVLSADTAVKFLSTSAILVSEILVPQTRGSATVAFRATAVNGVAEASTAEKRRERAPENNIVGVEGGGMG